MPLVIRIRWGPGQAIHDHYSRSRGKCGGSGCVHASVAVSCEEDSHDGHSCRKKQRHLHEECGDEGGSEECARLHRGT